jgi:hypothetical protein
VFLLHKHIRKYADVNGTFMAKIRKRGRLTKYWWVNLVENIHIEDTEVDRNLLLTCTYLQGWVTNGSGTQNYTVLWY